MQINAQLSELLELLIAKKGSSLYLSVGSCPAMRIYGAVVKLPEYPILCRNTMESIASNIMEPEQAEQFERKPELDLSLSLSKIGRFRVHFFRQRNEIAIVINHIKTKIPSFSELKLPELLKDMVMEKKGLILIVGATDAGKSTTLAAMLAHRNHHDSSHIVTIEDPIEFLHQHEQSIVHQREIGMDTNSYADAIRSALREAPDVVVIGEVRDYDTMKAALEIVQTGHLVLCTLHAINTYRALERIINFFPQEQRHQVLFDLATTLKAIFSQRLLPNKHNGRTVAIEILLATEHVCDLIQQGKIEQIKEVIERCAAAGMQTFDMALLNLVKASEITYEEALRRADSPNNLRIALAAYAQTEQLTTSHAADPVSSQSLSLKSAQRL